MLQKFNHRLRFIAIAFLLLCFTIAQSQTDKFSIEIAGDPSFSIVRGGSSVSSMPDHLGLTVGLFSNIKLNRTLSVYTGIASCPKSCRSRSGGIAQA